MAKSGGVHKVIGQTIGQIMLPTRGGVERNKVWVVGTTVVAGKPPPSGGGGTVVCTAGYTAHPAAVFGAKWDPPEKMAKMKQV